MFLLVFKCHRNDIVNNSRNKYDIEYNMADAVTSSVIRGVLHMSYVVCFTCHTWCASHVIRDVLHMRYLNYNDCSQSILGNDAIDMLLSDLCTW